jgi:hypothetical protein
MAEEGLAASIVASNDLDEEKLYELRDKVS